MLIGNPASAAAGALYSADAKKVQFGWNLQVVLSTSLFAAAGQTAHQSLIAGRT